MAVATTPFSGLGAKVQYQPVGSSTYINLAQLMDDSGFAGFDTVVIPLKLISQVATTKAFGSRDMGQYVGTMYWVPGDASVVDVFALYQARTIIAFKVTLPDGSSGVTNGSTVTFSGAIVELTPGNITRDDAPTAEFAIEISGDITVTPGS